MTSNPYTTGKIRKLHRFQGGLHLPENKDQSNHQPVIKSRIPKQLILPLQQHIGAPAELTVKVGDKVLKGQLLAKAQGNISAALHAPTSGTIHAIEDHQIPHPSCLKAPCVILNTDGQETWCELPPGIPDYLNCDAELLLERIRDTGIVGLGGAAFPAAVKLNAGPTSPIQTLIINGAECEPYITCDDMLMRDKPDQVLEGAMIAQHMVGARECIIGIEDNKPEAIAAMQAVVEHSAVKNIEVVAIPTLYPSGGEKQLIKILTGIEIPSGGIPAQSGILCHNIATAAAIADAILDGKPLISRYTTIAGNGIKNPRNIEVLIGTSAEELIEQAGGYTGEAHKLIFGGPMMGFALPSAAITTTKASNCLLVVSEDEAPTPNDPLACIRCGRCAEVCPASLLPQQLYWYSRAKDLEKAQEYNLFDCIECGCCSHVCPSHLPLVQYYRFAKTEAWNQEREKKSAEQARLRHEARTARLERLEAEKQAMFKAKKEALKKKAAAKKASQSEDPKKAAIEAAKKRAAAKKATLAKEGTAPKNTADLTDAQQRQVTQADNRRDTVKRAESESDTASTSTSEVDN